MFSVHFGTGTKSPSEFLKNEKRYPNIFIKYLSAPNFTEIQQVFSFLEGSKCFRSILGLGLSLLGQKSEFLKNEKKVSEYLHQILKCTEFH